MLLFYEKSFLIIFNILFENKMYICKSLQGKVKFLSGGDSPRLPYGTDSVKFRNRR